MSLIMDATDGWLTDWSKSGGRFKEWIRSMNMSAINHGWLYAIYMQPVYWWQNLRHIISWVPILWDDRDWDHSYLLIMMREKLRRMRILQEQHGNGSNRMKYAKEILVAELTLDRLIKDEYLEAEMMDHWKRYEADKRWASKTKEEINGNTYYSVPPPSEAERKESMSIYDRQEALRKQDLEYFGRYFAKHVRNWWD
jgi:hypothetical protein